MTEERGDYRFTFNDALDLDIARAIKAAWHAHKEANPSAAGTNVHYVESDNWLTLKDATLADSQALGDIIASMGHDFEPTRVKSGYGYNR